MAAEQQAEDEAGEAFEATLSESESESESGEDYALKTVEKQDMDGNEAQLSEVEVQRNREEFQALMEVVG